MQIEYIESKKHKVKALALNILLVFGLLWIPTPDSLQMPTALEKLDLYLTVLFSIPLVIQAAHIFKKTHIIFNSNGMEENISLSKTQIIPWADAQGIRFCKLFFQTYLLVDLKEPQKWFEKKSFFQKLKGRANFNRTKTPLHIPIGNLNVKPQKIIEDLNLFFQKKSANETLGSQGTLI